MKTALDSLEYAYATSFGLQKISSNKTGGIQAFFHQSYR